MKKISIIQPTFVPWLGYYEQMLISDVFVYLDDVQYTKKDWRNRNQLKSPYGPKYITVPIKKTNRETLINEALISYSTLSWEEKIINQIYNWYKQAPYRDDTIQMLNNIFAKKFIKLVDLIYKLNEHILNHIGEEKEIGFASEVPKQTDNKNDRIIEICNHFQADFLYDGKSAQNFIDIQLFKKNGIDVVFQNYVHKPYNQLHGDFIPYMSILDLIMNVSSGYRDIIVTNENFR